MTAPPAAAPTLAALRAALADLDPVVTAADWLVSLVRSGLDRLPLPGSGATLQRWQALAAVAEHDLSLAKLYEGHTDALAIMAALAHEARAAPGFAAGSGGAAAGSTFDGAAAAATFGTWAAEAPDGRTLIEPAADGRLRLRGVKCWCSGAATLSHGLLTAWHSDGRGPQLVRVAMRQPGIGIDSGAWRAVGMAGSASVDVTFSGALGDPVGGLGDYLSRPGFWQGGAGIAACWYGGALALARTLRRSLVSAPPASRGPFRLAALGRIDVELQATAALLREAAQWIDANPSADAGAAALRVRLAAEACATRVLDEAGRALGAAAFCRDAGFARVAADLPVFVRQSHAERDFAALAERTLASSTTEPWPL